MESSRVEPRPGHGMRMTSIAPVFVIDKATGRVCGCTGTVVSITYNGYEFDTPQHQAFAEAVGKTGKVDVITAALEIIGHHTVKKELDHRIPPPFYGV